MKNWKSMKTQQVIKTNLFGDGRLEIITDISVEVQEKKWEIPLWLKSVTTMTPKNSY